MIDRDTTTTRKRWLGRLGTAARVAGPFLAYLAARGLILGTVAPIWFSDTDIYAGQYRDGFGGGLLRRGRPWGYPFFLWLTGYHWGLAAAAQRLAATAAWFALARASEGLFRPAILRRLVFYGMLLVSLTTFAIMWDPMLLSESLSISLFVGLTAMWIRYQVAMRNGERGEGRGARGESNGMRNADEAVRGPRNSGAGEDARAPGNFRELVWLGGICALAAPFAGLRDSNAPLLLLLGGMVLVAAAMRGIRAIADCGLRIADSRLKIAGGLAVGVLLVVCALAHHRDVQVSRRSWSNIGNVLSRLIFAKELGNGQYMTDLEHIDWMVSHYQMPREETLARAGRTVNQAPPLSAEYERWLKERGAAGWAAFLWHHPGWVWETYGKQTQYSAFTGDYLVVENHKWLASWMEVSLGLEWIVYAGLGWFFKLQALNALLAIAAGALGAGWIAAGLSGLSGADGLRVARLGTLAWLIGTGALAALVAIFGDTIETWRHAIVGLMGMYAALPIGAALAAGAAVQWRKRRREAKGGMRKEENRSGTKLRKAAARSAKGRNRK